MAGLNPPAMAIVVLGSGALDTARRIQSRFPDARVHGLAHRVNADIAYDDFGAHVRALYATNTPIVALCSAGIVIRALASCLADKLAEPPVLAVAQDGSAVVPLLGGMSGVNVLAREIGAALDAAPAITTSGELSFGMCLLAPPQGYVLADIERGKRFVSDLLAGEATRIEGHAPWLEHARLPRSNDAQRVVRITPYSNHADASLLIHPRCVVAWIDDITDDCAERIRLAMREHGLAIHALAAIVAPSSAMTSESLADAARTLNAPLRFCERMPFDTVKSAQGVALHIADAPIDANTIGRARGTLTVIGLGPGSADLMTPAAKNALAAAQDILGYETYVRMAAPFRADQRTHMTDNREELQRARHAFELACEGRRVVVVSSGDPGVFAMAAAVFEALDTVDANPQWHAVKLAIVPGVSASLATAARAGAPLGHDFCVLSLSDNLKPWRVIEERIAHAGQTDLVMAFYNPLSKARPWQFDRAIDIVREHRNEATPVVLGRDIGRPGESMRIVTLGELSGALVDMRTMVIIGSSTTRVVGDWVYTPRRYE